MRWIDEEKRKVAELEKKQRAQWAKEAKERNARATRMGNRVARALTRLLPPGVELVGLTRAIISTGPGEYHKQTVTRISLGNGVQFNLKFRFCPGFLDYAPEFMEHADIVDIYAGGEEPGSDGTPLSGKICGVGTYWWRLSLLRLTKTEMREMLFEALEKHNSEHRKV